MKRSALIIFLFVAISCSKDNDPEKFSSINGYWVVRTPDGATTVTFRIGVDSDNNQVVDYAAMSHNGSDYNSEPIDAAIVVTSTTEIESLTFVTSRFVIRLLTLSANSDFTEMQIANSIFTIDGGFREFSMITATRQ